MLAVPLITAEKSAKKRLEHDEDYDPNKSFTEYYDADLDDDTFFNEMTAEYRYVFTHKAWFWWCWFFLIAYLFNQMLMVICVKSGNHFPLSPCKPFHQCSYIEGKPWTDAKIIVPWTFLPSLLSNCRNCGEKGKLLLLLCLIFPTSLKNSATIVTSVQTVMRKHKKYFVMITTLLFSKHSWTYRIT